MSGTSGLDNLHRRPAPGPDDPLGMLRACHQRILEHCRLLERLLQHLEDRGGDQDTRRAAARILRYFDTAAVDHHQDEEQDLFPLLARLPAATTLLVQLDAEHDDLERAWRELRPRLERLSVGGALIDDGLEPSARAFAAAYREHVERENLRLLPLAERQLSAEQKRGLGRAMAARRGMTPQ